jgi:hypothetical protein
MKLQSALYLYPQRGFKNEHRSEAGVWSDVPDLRLWGSLEACNKSVSAHCEIVCRHLEGNKESAPRGLGDALALEEAPRGI